MSTGFKSADAQTGSIAHPKDGAYRDKNVHGIRGWQASTKNVSVRSYSLTKANARYLDAVTKGHKSHVVNRALDYYRGRGGPTIDELYLNISALQDHITRLGEDNSRYESEQTLPQSRGKRGIFTRIWRFFF
jgi:hypothetical protein